MMMRRFGKQTIRGNELMTIFPRVLVLVSICVFSAMASGLAADMMRSPATQIRYKIDTAQSRFTVRASAGGLLSALGHDHNIAIREFSGEALVTPGSLSPASLNLVIKADSLAVTDKVSDKDRNEIQSTMKNNVLETGKYPEIVFKSTEISGDKLHEGTYRVRISGELTLHGETHQVTINSEVEFSAGVLRARGEFPVKQTAYKITPVSAAGGTVKVKDELKLSFDIVAKQQ